MFLQPGFKQFLGGGKVGEHSFPKCFDQMQLRLAGVFLAAHARDVRQSDMTVMLPAQFATLAMVGEPSSVECAAGGISTVVATSFRFLADALPLFVGCVITDSIKNNTSVV